LKKEDKGIKWERKCTDMICCLVFLVFLVAMVGLSFFALTKGDPARIVTPYDSDGNACGAPDQCSTNDKVFPQGEPCPTTYKFDGVNEVPVLIRDFTDYPYKYFPLNEEGPGLFNAVCVKACPGDTYAAAKNPGNCVLAAGTAGAAGTDYTVQPADKGGKNGEACGKACLRKDACVGFQFTTAAAAECRHWDKG